MEVVQTPLPPAAGLTDGWGNWKLESACRRISLELPLQLRAFERNNLQYQSCHHPVRTQESWEAEEPQED